MKTFMSRVAIFVSLAVVVLVCRWNGGSWPFAGDSGGRATIPDFERPCVPPRRPSPLPANTVRGEVRPPRQFEEDARPPHVVPAAVRGMLQSAPNRGAEAASRLSVARLAAEKSQVMDDLLNAESIPSDYGQLMVDLFLIGRRMSIRATSPSSTLDSTPRHCTVAARTTRLRWRRLSYAGPSMRRRARRTRLSRRRRSAHLMTSLHLTRVLRFGGLRLGCTPVPPMFQQSLPRG